MKILEVEGYKAFYGDMYITPGNPIYPSFTVTYSTWLYKPDTDCWYCAGSSYPAKCCKIVKIRNVEEQI